MTIEKLSDITPGKAGEVERWLREIDLAAHWLEDNWWKRADQVIERYADETAARGSTFNVLWSNTEILRAALYQRPPRPDVRDRAESKLRRSPLARAVAQVIERALVFGIDSQPDPFEAQIQALLTDHLLTGAGILRVRYMPQMVRRLDPVLEQEDGEGGFVYWGQDLQEVNADDIVDTDNGPAQEVEELLFERADIEHVYYRDFLFSPARAWRDVRWIAFRHRFTLEEAQAAFGPAKAGKLALSQVDQKVSQTEAIPMMFSGAEVFEIWDRAERRVMFISKGYADGPLLESDDRYGLRDFFPVAGLYRSVPRTDTLIPTPEYCLYQDQAEELDRVTARIDDLVQQIRVRGVYDASIEGLAGVLKADNKLLPVANWSSIVERGGIDGAISWVPFDAAVAALQVLYQQRDTVINTIYQVVGISDIARGATDPRETATAQQIKGQYGSLRIQPRRRALECYLRDTMRLQAELMAEKFAPGTLQTMTGYKITDEMAFLLRADAPRRFAIDVETDSTVAVDDQTDKAQVVELFGALAQFTSAAAPLMESGMVPPEAVKEMVLFGLRRFRAGREVEEALEAPAQQQQQGPDPVELAKVQIDAQRAETERIKVVGDLKVRAAAIEQKSAEALLKDDREERAGRQAALQSAQEGAA
ncbi:MAG: hypothetical protein AB7F51_15295 [Pseudorhodoplanes sp.]